MNALMDLTNNKYITVGMEMMKEVIHRGMIVMEREYNVNVTPLTSLNEHRILNCTMKRDVHPWLEVKHLITWYTKIRVDVIEFIHILLPTHFILFLSSFVS